ncbi:MAG TPA: hypothetical protein VF997_16470 [Polyangia bacterium]
MSDERLTPGQVQLVLRRAAELERRVPDHEALSADEVAALAAEVGLSPAAVDQALAEVRAGALDEPRPPRALERVLGASTIVVERTVRGGADEVQRRVERALRAQALRKQRDFGARSTWEHAPGWLPALRRALDWSGTISLGEAQTIDVSVVDAGAVGSAGERRSTVRLAVDVGALQRQVVVGASLGTAAGIAAALVLWAMQTPLPLEWLAAAGATAAGSIASVRGYRRRLAATATALERLCDALEHERAPLSPLDLLFAR